MVIDKLKRIFITHFPDGKVAQINHCPTRPGYDHPVPVYEFISFHTDLLVYMNNNDNDNDTKHLMCEVKGNTNDLDGFYYESIHYLIDTTAEFKRLMKKLSLSIRE